MTALRVSTKIWKISTFQTPENVKHAMDADRWTTMTITVTIQARGHVRNVMGAVKSNELIQHMRTATISVILAAVIILVTCGCRTLRDAREDKIVGTWLQTRHFGNFADPDSLGWDEERAWGTVEEYRTYSADKRIASSGKIDFTYYLSGEVITFNYNLSFNGSWYIKNDTLFENPDVVHLDLERIDYSAPYDTLLRQFGEELRLGEQQMFAAQMKSQILTTSQRLIVKVDENKLLTADDEGIRTQKRQH